MSKALSALTKEIRACRLCHARFRASKSGHAPRPVVWLSATPRIVIIGQAPGARVHATQTPFLDRSGDRLRDWMGVSSEQFYDRKAVAILPMAFCFPGYNAKGADLPPPPVCARTWHDRALAEMARAPLTILVGGYAQTRYLSDHRRVTETVQGWRHHAPGVFALPHPSWRNNAWLTANPWFASELLPALRARVADVLSQ